MNPQTCPFCHTKADKVPEMTLALKQKDLEIKKRDEEIASLQSQVSTIYKSTKKIKESIFLMKKLRGTFGIGMITDVVFVFRLQTL